MPKRLRHLVFGLTILFLSGPGLTFCGEMRWSPDGKWIAFAQESSPPADARIRPGWLFRPEEFDAQVERKSKLPKIEKLWIIRADSEIRYEIDRSETLLSDPCWSAGGNSLIYARIVRQPGGAFVWSLHEVFEVTRGGPKSRILRQIELPKDWSPPGRGVKAALVLRQIHAGANGLIAHGDPIQGEPVVFDSTSQEIRARFPKGYNVRIGQGGDQVAWLRGDVWPSHNAELVLTQLSDGQSKSLKNVLPDALPTFSMDGQSIYVGRHQKPPEAFSVPTGSIWPDIAKVDLKSFKAERYSRPIATPIPPTEELFGLSLTLDADEETLICSASIRNRPAEISWFQPKTAATYKRFPPLDVVTDATELSISPFQHLALRLGTPEAMLETSHLPAAICDPRSEALQPLVPDEASLNLWIDFLATAALRNLKAAAASEKPMGDSLELSRLSMLPTLGEDRPDSPVAARTKRIGNTGLAALGFDVKKPDLKTLERLAPAHREAACLFLALTRRYDAAVAALGTITSDGFDEETRFRQFAVQAELNIAAGKVHEGALIFEALQAGETRDLGELAPNGTGGWVLSRNRPTKHTAFMNRLSGGVQEAVKAMDSATNDPSKDNGEGRNVADPPAGPLPAAP